MSLLSKKQAAAMGQSIVVNGPIVVALNTMSANEKKRTKNKFDIAYFMAMEQISFHKFPDICELEHRHGVNISTNYTMETSAIGALPTLLQKHSERNWLLPYRKPNSFQYCLITPRIQEILKINCWWWCGLTKMFKQMESE